MFLLKYTLPLAALLALTGCGGGSETATDNQSLARGIAVGEPAPQQVVLPPEGTRLPVRHLLVDADSSIRKPRNAVLRDQAALSAFLEEHRGGRKNLIEAPKVDFATQMVIAVLPGESACFSEIHRVGVEGGKLEVLWRKNDPLYDCIAMVHAPIDMVAVARSNAEVVFKEYFIDYIEAPLLSSGATSNFAREDVVVRDAATWAKVWQSHTSMAETPSAPPAVDFSKNMVVGIFTGGVPVGCNHSTSIGKVAKDARRLTVLIVHGKPQGEVCPAAFQFWAEFRLVARSDLPVEFADQL